MDLEPRSPLMAISAPAEAAPNRRRTLPILISAVLIVAFTVASVVVVYKGMVAARAKETLRIRTEIETLNKAERQVEHFKLAWPPGDNAWESYQTVLENNSGSLDAHQGIQKLGDRYLTALNRLLEEQEFALAQRTLAAARQLEMIVMDAEYTPALDRFQVQLQTHLAATTQQRRELTERAGLTLGELQIFRDKLHSGGNGPAMVVIPAGQFVLGSPPGEFGRDLDEGPQLVVAVPSFALGQYEVTFAEYDQFVRSTGRALPDDLGWGRGSRPIIKISWQDARAYTLWLSEETGFRYRLPTEAEWEFAARAGTASTYHTGACLAPETANVDYRTAFGDCPGISQYRLQTLPVDELSPNAWGLYNLYGNVREFVQDCLQDSYALTPPDGSAFFSSEAGHCGLSKSDARMVRGGAWSVDIKSARTANRYAVPERYTDNSLGFRVARDLH